MNSYLAVLVLLGLVVVGWRFARRKPKAEAPERVRRPERRVDGFQVWSPLHLRMGRSCLFDHGMQYGPGFRRKEGPLLPHDPDCRCETIPFSYLGSEVFAGALRRVGESKTQEPGFPLEAVTPLIAALKRVNAEPLASTVESYLDLVGIASFDEGVRPAVTAFLRDRYAFLSSQERASTAPGAPPAEGDAPPLETATVKTP